MGEYSIEEALAALLSKSGLEPVKSASGYVLQARREEDAGDETQLGTVTVTDSAIDFNDLPPDKGFKAEFQSSATKTPLPIRETPQSISVITQDSLEARQVTDLGQALETAAGVNLYSGSGPFAGRDIFGLGAIQIRGIDTDFLTDIREDGFVSPIFAAQPDLAPYERIEVVKGPSSLYGRGSAGGFVNRVRKKPLPEFQAEIAPSIGSFDFYRVDGDVTGPLFARARGRLVLAYEDAGSFVDFAESERAVIAPSLEFDLTDTTRLLVQGIYQEDRFFPTNGFPLQQEGENFRAPNIRRSLFVGAPNEDETTGEIVSASVQLDQQLSDQWLATLRLARSATEHRSQTDNYAFGIQPNGDVGLYSSAFRIDSDVWAGEIRLNGRIDLLGRPANLTVGAEYTDVQNINDQRFGVLGTANIYAENFADFPTVAPVPSFNGLFEQPSTGVYAQLQFRPFERLSVLLGGRYDSAETTFENRVGGTKSERDDDAFTGRIGLVFDVRRNVSLYGLYAESFQPVLFNTRSDGELLEPEEGKIYEGGIKTAWFEGRLGVNAALFRIERENVPINDPNNMPGEFFSVSGGLLRSDGFELEINGEPLPGWNVSFAGTLLDSEFTEGDPQTIGNAVIGTADWQVGVYTSYELQSGTLQGLGVGLGLFAIADRAAGEFLPGTLDGYERVDLSLFYNGIRNTKIALQARNVFNERYVEGSDRIGGFNQFGSPTAYLLTLRYDFKGVGK
ncbi:MAG: TonB-dependent siderophore receptor [Burkholderiales bacterium]